MASKLSLVLTLASLLLSTFDHQCSASGRLLNPKRPTTLQFGLDPPYLLRPSFPAPEDQETQTPPHSMTPTLPLPLQQPIMTPPPPPPPPSQDEANLTPAFPFPSLSSLPKFPPFPFIPTTPSIDPSLPTSFPMPPELVNPVLPSSRNEEAESTSP